MRFVSKLFYLLMLVVVVGVLVSAVGRELMRPTPAPGPEPITLNAGQAYVFPGGKK